MDQTYTLLAFSGFEGRVETYRAPGRYEVPVSNGAPMISLAKSMADQTLPITYL
jgi:hypothetical protein